MRPLTPRECSMATSANLNVMIKAARKAGRALLKDFSEVEQLQVSVKGPGDFVSRADRNAEQTIREMLTEARPTYGFLGEEGGPTAGEDPTRRWIVDPLDGTTNYLHGLPHWSVSIALEHKGQIVAGVIHDPVKDETFYAEKGEGAWLNDSRLRVSGRSRITSANLSKIAALAAMMSPCSSGLWPSRIGPTKPPASCTIRMPAAMSQGAISRSQ